MGLVQIFKSKTKVCVANLRHFEFGYMCVTGYTIVDRQFPRQVLGHHSLSSIRNRACSPAGSPCWEIELCGWLVLPFEKHGCQFFENPKKD